MSSRSNGVTNVRLSRSTNSCVSRSPSCSSSLMRAQPASVVSSGKVSSRKTSSSSRDGDAVVRRRGRRARRTSRFCGHEAEPRHAARSSTRSARRVNHVRRSRTDASPTAGRRPTAVVPCELGARGIPVFQAYRGTEPPRFASQAELECAKVLDYYGVPWKYEPTHASSLEQDEDGRVIEAFTPDFYLPEQDLYLEITVMKQSLVTRKNRKLRKLRERYPDVKVKLFYRRDLERLAAALQPRPRLVGASPRTPGSARSTSSAAEICGARRASSARRSRATTTDASRSSSAR